jgi:hypothetical protein
MAPIRKALAHPGGVRLAAVLRVLSRPERQVIEVPLDFGNRPIKAADEEVAGMTDAPATEIRPMVVILNEFGGSVAERASLQLDSGYVSGTLTNRNIYYAT